MRILIIDDDREICENIGKLLRKRSWAADLAFTAEDGYQKAIDESYDAIIIDWMLPDEEGIVLCKRIRKEFPKVPILMLTARSTLGDTVTGLSAGADDYVTKPFAIEELDARLHTLMRRSMTPSLAPIMKVADLTIDTNTHEVRRGNKSMELSPKEYALIHYLALHMDQAVERMEIFSHAWDEQADIFSNTVDVHIRYIRKKLDDGFKQKLIRTVKGKGYMLCSH